MMQTGTVTINMESAKVQAYLKLHPATHAPEPLYFTIVFPKPFLVIPQIALSLAGFRGGFDQYEFRMKPQAITLANFQIKLITDYRTSINLLDVTWLAFEN